MEYINESYVYPSVNEVWSNHQETTQNLFQTEENANVDTKKKNETKEEAMQTVFFSNDHVHKNTNGIKQRISGTSPKIENVKAENLLKNMNNKPDNNEVVGKGNDDLSNQLNDNGICDISQVDKNHVAIRNSIAKSNLSQFCIFINIRKMQKENLCIEKKKEIKEKNSIEEYVEDTRFNCEVCGKNLASKAGLEDHMRMHTGEKPFKCTVCEKQFRSKGSLNYHSLTHTGEKSHICKICGRGFAAKFNLKTHEKYHTGEKPFRCKKCDKGFTSATGLNYHIKKHICRKEYNCHVCGAQFANSNALNSHIRIHNVNYPFKRRKRKSNVRPRKLSQSEDVVIEKKIIHAEDISMDDSFLEISFPSLYREDLADTCLLDDGLLFREL